MSPRVFLFLGLAVLAVAMVNADCPCGGGVDVCSCHSQSVVVRPPRIPRPCPVARCFHSKIIPPSYSSDHVDYCGHKHPHCHSHVHVPSAPKPHPRCPCHGHHEHGSSSSSTSTCTCDSAPVTTIPFSPSDFDSGYVHEYDEESSSSSSQGVYCGQKQIGADAVSLHLAYTAGLNRPSQHVKEGLISYGFSKTPEYQPMVKQTMDINEEGLNVVDKKILELRLPTQSSSSFFVEEDFPEEEAEFESQGSSGLSYAELGYIPEKGKPCAITNVPKDCPMPKPVVYVAHHGCACGHTGGIHSPVTCGHPHPSASSSTSYHGEPCSAEASSEDQYAERENVVYSAIKSSVIPGCGGHGTCAGTCGGTCGGRVY